MGQTSEATFFFIEEKFHYQTPNSCKVLTGLPHRCLTGLTFSLGTIILYHNFYKNQVISLDVIHPICTDKGLSLVNEFFQNRENFIGSIRISIPFIPNFFVVIEKNVIGCGHPYFFRYTIDCDMNCIKCNRAEVLM